MIGLGRLQLFKLLTDFYFNSGQCQNSYFEHDIEQESMRKPLFIKWEWMNDFAVFRLLFPCIWSNWVKRGLLAQRGSATLGPLHMSPLDWDGPVIYRDEFRIGFIWEISARFPRWEKAKAPGDEFWRQIRETKQTRRNTKKITFASIIVSATIKTVSLQLNGMLMMENTAGNASRCETARIYYPGLFHPGKRAEVSIGRISSPLFRDPGWKNRDLSKRASFLPINPS